MAKKYKISEKLERETSAKEIYHFKNPDRNVNVLCKEVYKKQDQIIHYPFRSDTGEPKYQTIRKFVYSGFDGKLPRGVIKSFFKGYGFTKIFNPLLYHLQGNFEIETVIVNKTGLSSIDTAKKVVVFSFKDLDSFFPQIKNLFDSQREDTNNLVKDLLGKIFPGEIEAKEIKYKKHTVFSFLERWKDNIDEFSKEDIGSIISLFSAISGKAESIDQTVILKSRESIEEYFIEDVLKKFRELLKKKTSSDRLEDKWQEFLKTHSWIFAQLFSFPVIVYEDQAYMGGKNISNQGGKFADFLLQNNLTKNAAFVEIKTHRSDILKKGIPYRGKDVFPMSDELSGAINQVLDQRDNFQKSFYTLKAKAKKPIETFNSKCIVLIGMMKDLDEERLKSFELFRSNSKDVEIVTFDELENRLQIIFKLMTNQPLK